MTSTLTKKRFPKGFTLIEILVCMALISTALIAVFKLQAKNLDLQAEARFVTTAKYLSQDRLSRIQSETDLEAGDRSGNFDPHFPGFTYEEEITREDELENLFKVKVHIMTQDAYLPKKFTVETYIFSKST